MPLPMSHNAWTGTYFHFDDWRARVAKAAGYEVELDEDPQNWTELLPESDTIRERILQGHWEPEDPVLILLMHSDCEGVIQPPDGRRLAARLDELLDKIGAGEPNAGDWQDTTRRFIKGLTRAAEARQNLEFG